MDTRVDKKLLFYDIQRYLKDRFYPEMASGKDKAVIRKLIVNCFSHQGLLHSRSSDGIQLKCLTKEEAKKVIDEVHYRICSTHMNNIS